MYDMSAFTAKVRLFFLVEVKREEQRTQLLNMKKDVLAPT